MVVMAMVFSAGAAQVMAAPGAFGGFRRGDAPPSFDGEMPKDFRGGLTEAEKKEMEAKHKERMEKMEAFVKTLNEEQKALYDAMMPARPEMPERGERPAMPERGVMLERGERPEMSGRFEGFERPEAGFGRGQRFDMDFNQKQKPEIPDLSAMMEEMKQKQEAFVASLTAEQKAIYEELFNWNGVKMQEGKMNWGGFGKTR